METDPKLPVYKPLYPPEGGPLAGFKCCQTGCGAVTRTERGMRIHVFVCHGIRFQRMLPLEPPPEPDLPKNLGKRV